MFLDKTKYNFSVKLFVKMDLFLQCETKIHMHYPEIYVIEYIYIYIITIQLIYKPGE